MEHSLRISWLLLVVACSSAPRTVPPPPRPVVVDVPPPPEKPPVVAIDPPALRLPKTFVATGYVAKLTIDPKKPRFIGAVEVSGTITERTSIVWLHARGLEFTSVTAPGTPGMTHHADDLIALTLDPPLEPGPWTVKFGYTGAIDAVSTAGMFVQKVAGASYIYTQLEALYARRVFPCIDEPDSKVPWQLTIEVPNGNIAVSNTPVVKKSESAGMRTFEFAKTKPLPSYLVALGVGPFDIVDGGKTKSGIPVRIVTLKGRGPDAAYAAQTTARVLDLLETWFATPYPYEKLDMLTIPLTIGFGAMENAGLVTHAENIILFDPMTLAHEQRNVYIRIVSHELAHQWFGNLVTMTWWDDLWLNEGFATWLQTKITAQFEPAWQAELAAVETRNHALASDSVVSARRVRQPIATVDDIESAFDGITYSKGASVLAMFESYVGPNAFQRGVRDYIKARAFGNATSADFVAAISSAARTDLAPAFSTFLDQVGAPELDAKLVCDKTGAHVELAQQRYVAPGSPVPPAQLWQVPVCVAFEQAGKRATACTLLTEKTGSLALPGKRCPRWVMPNVDGHGYYRVRYTQQQAQALRDEAWSKLTPAEHRAVFADVRTAVHARERRLPLTLALSFVPKLLGKPNRFVVSASIDVSLSLDRQVPTELREKYAHYLRTTFGPGATNLGLVPGPNDTLDDESMRAALVGAVAWHGRDPDLVAKAIELVASWRELPAATRELVLAIAVDGDANVAAKIMRDVKTEQDRTRREEMLAALGSQRDPKRYEAALELIWDRALDARETMELLQASSTEPTRAVAERFLRANTAKLLALLPKDSVTGLAGWFAGVIAGSCDEPQRKEAETYSRAQFESLPGGKRVLDQVFEEMDQCIAMRRAIAPDLRGWLNGIKTNRGSRGK